MAPGTVPCLRRWPPPAGAGARSCVRSCARPCKAPPQGASWGAGEERGTLVWRPARYAASYLILTHPAYAGACTFGRRHHAAGRVPGEQTPRTRRPAEAWQVLVHDVSPAYISWEPYLQHRERLLLHQGQFAPRPGCPVRGNGLTARNRLLCAVWTAPESAMARAPRRSVSPPEALCGSPLPNLHLRACRSGRGDSILGSGRAGAD
jgi:hypothetical protein